MAEGDTDKSGVKPQVITLPQGPGSLSGLGASFEPDLNTGTAAYQIAFAVPLGTGGFQPELALRYNGGNPNGPWGIGWKLDIPQIQRSTDDGLPSYNDLSDRFVFSNGEKLVALGDGDYRLANEGLFMRFRRLTGGGWEAWHPDGTRLLFGETSNARETNIRGVFTWKLERQIDTQGNTIVYRYLQDGGYAYLREVRYSTLADGRTINVLIAYEPRSDVYADRRSRAPIRIGLRAADLQVWAYGQLARMYRFAYEPPQTSAAHSMLQSVTEIGSDGVSALPTTTFAYTTFDATSSRVVSMQTPPPVSPADADADLVDINGDGLPDLAYTPSEGHRYYLNRGNGQWQSEPVLPSPSPSDRLSSSAVRIADMDGNGYADLLVKAGVTPGAPFYYYAGQRGQLWQAASRVDYSQTLPFDPDAPNVRLVDLDGDRRVDLLQTTPSSTFLWLARADGSWPESADIVIDTPAVGGPLMFDNPRVHLGEMSGDQLQDLVFAANGLVVYYPHNGLGEFDEPIVMANPPDDLGPDDVMLELGDINGDGLDDILQPGNRFVRYWLNLGDDSFGEPVFLNDTPAYNQATTAVRLADMDGDGAIELLFADSTRSEEEAYQYVDFSVKQQPFLLNSIANGLGRTIRIEYASSTSMYSADWQAGQPWTTTLPFPVQVVSQQRVLDANSGDQYVTEYHYRDGYYDGVEREFRGFGETRVREIGDTNAPTSVVRRVYDLGIADESRKGLLLTQENLAEDSSCAGDYRGCFERIVNTVTSRTLLTSPAGLSVRYSFISQTDNQIYEQQPVPVILRSQFDRDDFGNLILDANYGQVCDDDLACGDDELLTRTEYALNAEAWIVNKPMRVRKSDLAGAFVAEKTLFYDGSPYVGLSPGEITRGELMRQEDSLGPAGDNRFIPTQRHTYDRYGNLIGILDANDGLTTITYDSQSATYPVLERIQIDEERSLSYAASYDYRYGTVATATDFNGHASTYRYDPFGRLTSIVLPGDTLVLPTQRFRYDLGSPRSAIVTEQRERSGEVDVLTSIAYFDGLGRKLQERAEAEDGQVAVTEATRFNARQAPIENIQPYFDTSLSFALPSDTISRTTTVYDAQERPISVTHPDGPATATRYHPLHHISYDEEDTRTDSPHVDTPTTRSYDGLGRLVAVEELNRVSGKIEPIATQYSYDRLGNLTGIVDAQGNRKTISYDGLSRKVRSDDPNRGVTTYSYDDNGNLIETRDAKSQIIRYRYDAADRVLSEDWLQPGESPQRAFSYFYDGDLAAGHADATNTLGRLAYVTDQEGATLFSYDARGNIAGRIRSFTDEGLSFVTLLQHDAMDRLSELIYPDGSQVTYKYNEQGLLETVPEVVENIDYLATGQRSNARYSNGANTSYTYDVRLRLNTLRTTSAGIVVQDLAYSFDGTNNVTAVADSRPDRTAQNDQSQNFSYDSLYRLTGVNGTYGQINYGYNSVGNMVRQTSTVDDTRLNLGEMGYGTGDAGPYALTTAGGRSYGYDANGNRTGDGVAVYNWNPRDWLESVTQGENRSTYGYDSEGMRVRQTVTSGDTAVTTLYIGEHAEVRGSTFVRYVLDDQKRVAQERVPFERSRLLTGFSDSRQVPTNVGERHWYFADHLGSTSLLLDAEGLVTSEVVYYPYGLTRYERNGADAPYRFTGKELDVSGLSYFGARYYDALTGRFISVDPLYAEKSARGVEQPHRLNTYLYALGNPLKYTDPDGRDALDVVHTALSMASLVPGPTGSIASGLNALAYGAEGKYAQAGISAIGIIPGAAQMYKAYKIAQVSKAGGSALVLGKMGEYTKLARDLTKSGVKASAFTTSKKNYDALVASGRHIKQNIRYITKAMEQHRTIVIASAPRLLKPGLFEKVELPFIKAMDYSRVVNTTPIPAEIVKAADYVRVGSNILNTEMKSTPAK
jgi:RHS repeat-associated protein